MAFQFYISKIGALVAESEIPDFETIKENLEEALTYATTDSEKSACRQVGKYG